MNIIGLSECLLSQNVVGLPASFAPAVSQSYLQCESDGLEGFGCHDTALRLHGHPHQADGSAAPSTGALRPQPAPRTAAADPSDSGESPLRSQVRLKEQFSLSSHTFRLLKGQLCSFTDAIFEILLCSSTQ